MLIASDLRHALDAAEFARACGVEPDPWQAALLREQPKRTLILASRQVGKTLTTALLTLHVATFTPGALCVVISPSQRQSSEFVRTVRLLHQHIEGAAPFKTESVTKLELANDARILALPGGEEGKAIRGLAGARLIVVDEASRVPDELMSVARPMLATNREGALVALTTPAGRRGWFYESWHEPGDAWHRIRVSAADCPRITQQFLDEERRALGQIMFESEYGLIFHDNEMSAFPTSIINSAFTDTVQPLW